MSCQAFLSRGATPRYTTSVVLALLAFAVGDLAATSADAQQPPADAAVREGYLYNLTSQPFSFQLHRTDGPAWTNVYTIPPGQRIAVRPPRPGQQSEIQGITGDTRGFVLIRYRDAVLNGYTMFKLPAQNPADQRFEPTWFAVKDATGITRLIQEPSIEQARTVQQTLQQQPPLTADELERTKKTMQANWVLTWPQDGRNNRGGFGWCF